MAWLSAFLASDGLTPHGFCLLWRPELVWLHVYADAVIAASYFSIPFVILLFALRRADFGFRWVAILFCLFIVTCGITHLFGILTLWTPAYGAEAVAKLVNATVSLVTAG